MDTTRCAVEGCTRSRRNGGHGWCPTHYGRWRKHGDPGPASIRQWGTNEGHSERRECTIEGCDRLVQGHGYCQMHYARWLRHGDPLRKRGREPKPLIYSGTACSSIGWSWNASSGACSSRTRRFIIRTGSAMTIARRTWSCGMAGIHGERVQARGSIARHVRVGCES
jgi:hypothetical protein